MAKRRSVLFIENFDVVRNAQPNRGGSRRPRKGSIKGVVRHRSIGSDSIKSFTFYVHNFEDLIPIDKMPLSKSVILLRKKYFGDDSNAVKINNDVREILLKLLNEHVEIRMKNMLKGTNDSDGTTDLKEDEIESKMNED